MRGVAGPLDLLGHEAPAGRPLERELDLAAGELSQPRTHLDPRRRRDPAAPQLTRLLVERLVRDLASGCVSPYGKRAGYVERAGWGPGGVGARLAARPCLGARGGGRGRSGWG